MINSTQPHPGTPTPPPLPRLPLDPPCPALSLPLNSPYLLLPSVHFLLGLPSPPFVSSLRDLFDQFPWMTRTALLSVYTLLFLPAFRHRGSFSAAQIRKLSTGPWRNRVRRIDIRRERCTYERTFSGAQSMPSADPSVSFFYSAYGRSLLINLSAPSSRLLPRDRRAFLGHKLTPLLAALTSLF